MKTYICPLCNLEVVISEESDEPDVEIIDSVVCHGTCILRIYEKKKSWTNLSIFERNLLKRARVV